MNLDDIPAGSLCVVDTNVLLYAEQGLSAQAQRLLERCAKGEISITLPHTVLQDLGHKMMLAEALTKGLVSGDALTAQLARRPEDTRKLSIYRSKIQALTALGVGIEPCTRADLLEVVFTLQERYGLLPASASLLAVALRLKADALVSANPCFQKIAEPNLHAPSDLRPRILQ